MLTRPFRIGLVSIEGGGGAGVVMPSIVVVQSVVGGTIVVVDPWVDGVERQFEKIFSLKHDRTSLLLFKMHFQCQTMSPVFGRFESFIITHYYYLSTPPTLLRLHISNSSFLAHRRCLVLKLSYKFPQTVIQEQCILREDCGLLDISNILLSSESIFDPTILHNFLFAPCFTQTHPL